MPQLIDFSQYQPQRELLSKKMSSPWADNASESIDISDDEYKLTVNILVHNHPNKISFTIEEVATQLNVGKEFVRRRVKSGRIKAVHYGDKPMIHISELARLLTKGIN